MIVIASDHAGFRLKQELIAYLETTDKKFIDCGCNGERVDYPDIAEKACAEIIAGKAQYGVLICGTGIGISMAANKIHGIRAAHCSDYYSAKYSRLHNDANVICLGGRTTGPGLACELLEVFLNTEFEGGRHAVRVDKIMKLEEKIVL